MTITTDIVKACRSLRASYNINNSKLTHFFIKMTSGEEVAKAQATDIATLGGKASQVDVNPPVESIPESTGIQVVSDAITVMVADGYEDKVPEDLKKQNSEKLAAYEKEVNKIQDTIANFERLMSLEDKD